MVISMVYPVTGFLKKLACASALIVTCAASGTALAEPAGQIMSNDALQVLVDRAKVVRMDRDADTVIVGNPIVVDATIHDSRTVILTGRSYGITNLIVLDSVGEPIIDERVIVENATENMVRIYRRADRETLACSPVCERVPVVGDQNEQFQNTITQIQNRNTLSTPTSN